MEVIVGHVDALCHVSVVDVLVCSRKIAPVGCGNTSNPYCLIALIMNPVELGKPVDAKSFFLDVKVLRNRRSIIHIEMQAYNQHNWPDRSLSYLCRTFDGLKQGDGYLQARPVVQIGLLDYTLYSEYPEFYAVYEFRNVKKGYMYSDKLCLCV